MNSVISEILEALHSIQVIQNCFGNKQIPTSLYFMSLVLVTVFNQVVFQTAFFFNSNCSLRQNLSLIKTCIIVKVLIYESHSPKDSNILLLAFCLLSKIFKKRDRERKFYGPGFFPQTYFYKLFILISKMCNF